MKQLLDDGGPKSECTLEEAVGVLVEYDTCTYVKTLGDKGRPISKVMAKMRLAGNN